MTCCLTFEEHRHENEGDDVKAASAHDARREQHRKHTRAPQRKRHDEEHATIQPPALDIVLLHGDEIEDTAHNKTQHNGCRRQHRAPHEHAVQAPGDGRALGCLVTVRVAVIESRATLSRHDTTTAQCAARAGHVAQAPSALIAVRAEAAHALSAISGAVTPRGRRRARKHGRQCSITSAIAARRQSRVVNAPHALVGAARALPARQA